MNNSFIYLTIIFICSVTCFNALTNPQLHGEDEATTFIIALNLLNDLKNFEIFNFFKTIIAVNHPPGRYLLPIPFIEILRKHRINANSLFFSMDRLLCFNN